MSTPPTDAPHHTVTGGCRCGRVRFRGTTAGLKAVACACADCQRSSGTFVSVAVGLAAASFEVTAGHDDLGTFADTGESGQPVHRSFCRTCGSPLFARPASYDHIVSVRAVALDAPCTTRPIFSIFDENVPEWMHFDGVPSMDDDEASEAAETATASND